MMDRQPWIDHVFNLGINIGWTQNVMSRIKDCAERLEHHCGNLSDEQLSFKPGGKWSIKEHIGHLIDLEALWINRFLQFAEFVPELIHADMSNQKTEKADHNAQPIEHLVNAFKAEREKLINCYNELSMDVQKHEAIHPRIKMPMKPVDLLFFVAEHDDHHITTISQIKDSV